MISLESLHKLIKWIKSTEGRFKLNYDGSLSETIVSLGYV